MLDEGQHLFHWVNVCRFKTLEMMLNHWSMSSCIWPTIRKERRTFENILAQQGSHNIQTCTYSYFFFCNFQLVFVKQEGVIPYDFVHHLKPLPMTSPLGCCREHDEHQTTIGCTMQRHIQVHYKGRSSHIFPRYLWPTNVIWAPWSCFDPCRLLSNTTTRSGSW